MACIRRGGTGPRLREVEVRHREDDRHRTCISKDRVVHGQQDGQGGRRRSPDIGCAPSGQEHQAHHRDEQGDGPHVHVPPPLGYNSSRGAIEVFAGSFLRRRIRMVTMKTSRKRTPPLRTSGKVADVDAVTWKFVVAETSGLSGVSSLFTSRIVRSWSPSGNETRNAGSTWTSSSSTLPSSSSWRWPSFGEFGCPCGSTRVKFVIWNETYMPWPVRSNSFGDTILIVGTPPAGPWVDTTRTDVFTSGLSAFPTWSTSCRRIVCGPELSGSTIGSTATGVGGSLASEKPCGVSSLPPPVVEVQDTDDRGPQTDLRRQQVGTEVRDGSHFLLSLHSEARRVRGVRVQRLACAVHEPQGDHMVPIREVGEMGRLVRGDVLEDEAIDQDAEAAFVGYALPSPRRHECEVRDPERDRDV